MVASSYPVLGVAVMVTVAFSAANVGFAVMVPLLAVLQVTEY